MRTPTRKMERWPKLRAETGDGYKDDVTTARCKMVIIMIWAIVMMSSVRLKHVLQCIALQCFTQMIYADEGILGHSVGLGILCMQRDHIRYGLGGNGSEGGKP